MSPLVKKEVRLLLPAWIVAMVLAAISPLLYSVSVSNPDSVDFFFRLLFSIAVLLLGISSFGQELNSGVFTLLLSQPFERRRLWNAKITTLAVAFIFVWLAATVSFLIRFHIVSHYESHLTTAFFWTQYRANTLEILALSSVAAFSGGLWTTLLLRHVTAAFWFTLLIPAAVFWTISLGSNYLPISGQALNAIIIVAMSAYSAAGFFWARHLFLRAQDVQWTGGDFSFTWRTKTSAAQSAGRRSRPRHWLSAFIWKEIQLQQINILIAVVIFVFHVASVIIRKIHPQFQNPDTRYILESIWGVWLLLPLLIGSAAVAEERKLGVIESQLCLPLSRYTQLFIKFTICLLLSLFLGGFMPLWIEGTKYLNEWIYAAAAAIFFISFYASTVARSTIQAMGLAVGAVISIWIFQFVTNIDLWRFGINFSRNAPGLLLLKCCLGIPILLLVFGSLAVWNFKWLHQSGAYWRRNLTVLLAALLAIFILTNSVYFRVWEYLAPVDPPHGPARLSASPEIKFTDGDNTLYTVLPDGRLWTETVAFRHISSRWMGRDVLNPQRSVSRFIGGSNWADISCNMYEAVGIQSDGTLWAVQRKSREAWNQTGPFTLTQIGLDTDWSQVAAESMGFLLLKKDGSLWGWGTNDYDWKNSRAPLLRKLKQDLAEAPVRIGGQAGYTAIFSSDHGAYAKKDDGTVWRWISWNDKFVSALVRQTNWDSNYLNLQVWGGDSLEVKTNGELWLSVSVSEAQGKYRHETQQLGVGEKWKFAIHPDWGSVFAVRDDGTLWKWSWWPGASLFPRSGPVELGHDWIALAATGDGAFSLSSDGTLWAWGQPSRYLLLAPSRKPMYVGNIFEGAPANP